MKKTILRSRGRRFAAALLTAALFFGAARTAAAQEGDTRRMFGDTARTSAMKYVGSLDEALALSKKTRKPVFFNCYASWSAPCVAMDQYVFSNEAFAREMSKDFVCLLVNMRSDEGKILAKRYGVRAYACYLVLDADGNVVHRIQGGSKLSEFRENVRMALSPKTSLAGTRSRYESGKASRTDLFNYLRALRVAGSDSLFFALAPEYTKDMAWSDYARPGHWMFVGLHRKRGGDFYNYLLRHKAEFLKTNDLLRVNNKFESMLTPVLLAYACGDAPYDSADIAAARADLRTFAMADTCACDVLCDIATLRGTRRYAELIDYMNRRGRLLDKYHGIRANIELTFNFPDATAAEKTALKDYLARAVERERGTRGGDRLRTFLDGMKTEGSGITFATGTLAEALAQAKAEGKSVFLDCYTTWCGPCRVMSNTVFTRSEVGEYFNSHFVSFKLDMERGEGPDAAKRYGVKAYPTMLFLDAEGRELRRIVGSKSAEALIEEAKAAAK